MPSSIPATNSAGAKNMSSPCRARTYLAAVQVVFILKYNRFNVSILLVNFRRTPGHSPTPLSFNKYNWRHTCTHPALGTRDNWPLYMSSLLTTLQLMSMFPYCCQTQPYTRPGPSAYLGATCTDSNNNWRQKCAQSTRRTHDTPDRYTGCVNQN